MWLFLTKQGLAIAPQERIYWSRGDYVNWVREMVLNVLFQVILGLLVKCLRLRKASIVWELAYSICGFYVILFFELVAQLDVFPIEWLPIAREDLFWFFSWRKLLVISFHCYVTQCVISLSNEVRAKSSA